MVVLEARDKVGGAVDTSAPFPDHPEIGVSTYSYVMSLMPAFIIEELRLRDHGYRRDARSVRTTRRSPTGARSRSTATTQRDACVGVAVLREGRRHASRTARRGSTASPRWWDRCCTEVPPNLGSMALGDLLAQAQAAWKMRGLGSRGVARRHAAVHDEHLRPARPLVRVRADEDDHDGRRTDRAVGGTGRARNRLRAAPPRDRRRRRRESRVVNWGFPQGGMGAVSEAIRGSADSFGAEIRTGSPVRTDPTRTDEPTASRSRTATSCMRRPSSAACIPRSAS